MRQSHIFGLGVRRLTTYEGGPFWAVESTLDLTYSNRTQTRGGYTTRRRERFETKSHFWTRRTSTRYLRGRPILGGGTHPRLISVFLRSTEAQNAYFTEKVKKIQLFTNFMSNRFTFTSNLFIKIQVFLRSTEAQNDLFTEIVKKILHFTNFMSNRFTFTADLFGKTQVFMCSTEDQNTHF